METQFIYSKYVTGKNNIGRRSESAVLSNLLGQGENVVLYEAPKSGKRSLIQQTFFNMRIAGQAFSIAELSLQSTRSAGDLALRLGSAVIGVCASTPDEYRALAEGFLGGTHLIFDEEAFSSGARILSLNWDVDDEDLLAVFRLPFRLAVSRGQKIYVLVEEFQNIMQVPEGEHLCGLFESVLKELTQEQRALCSYILTGSQVNAMKDIFETRHLFRRCVERVQLQPIETKDIIEHVVRNFLSNGKVIDRELLLGVCKLFRNNIFYINHFCAICNSLSKGYIMEPLLVEALDMLVSIHEPRFRATMNDLTTFQVSLLRAILDGNTRFSSTEVIENYGLNSSANVRRLKDALSKKEIVTFGEHDEPVLLDPLFEYWVRKYYFEIKES
ncbi:MAG: hypothetical protein IJU63_07780 [Bacteroidales bacterium]|nr:hypothetical protein [Bacteroidales bacterium]